MTRRALGRASIRAGIFGGIAVIYFALTGMIENFDIRVLVDGNVTLGKLLLALPAFLTGYLLVRPRLVGGEYRRPSRSDALAAGAVAGALIGGLTIAALALTLPFGPLTVRAIFFHVSPTLLTIVEFGRSVPVAALILIAGGAAIGAAG